MIRMTKVTDYGFILLTYMAALDARGVYNARDLAQTTHLPLPMVSKILKLLARDGLLTSARGVKGGYSLARPAEDISVAEVIGAIEGPFGITECGTEVAGACSLEAICAARSRWGPISRAIERALGGVRLSAMRPAPARPGGIAAGKGVAP